MARTTKYDWPDDQKLQALLDEHGTVETARQVGCPPSSLNRRIRRRGLRRPRERQQPDAANPNGKPDAANPDGKPDAEKSVGKPAQKGKLIEDLVRDRREAIERSLTELARENPSNPAATFEPGADSAPAKRASRPKRARGLLRRVPPPIWRALAVLGLAAVAALAAFISVSNDPKTYERETSFAIRPSSDVPPEAVNDVLGTLAQPDSAITETIVNMLGSPRLRDFAAQSAGVNTSSVGGSGAEYVWSATRRTGSTIVDVRVTGPDDDKLLAMQTAAGPEAARLVEASYPPYRLETLSAPSPPQQVGPKVARTVGLALLLGALIGITLVLAERRLRASVAEREGPSRAPASRGEYRER
jgi:capsular polysaccharide biosynthesis protein